MKTYIRLVTPQGRELCLTVVCDGKRECPRCHQVKSIDEFGFRLMEQVEPYEIRNQPYCKPCRATPKPEDPNQLNLC